MPKQYFRATETIHSSVAEQPVLKGDVLPEDHPIVKAHPVFFSPVEEAGDRANAHWETAVGGPAEARNVSVPRKPGRPKKADAESQES